MAKTAAAPAEGYAHPGSYRGESFQSLRRFQEALERGVKEGKGGHDAQEHLDLIRMEMGRRAWSVHALLPDGTKKELERFRGCTEAMHYRKKLGTYTTKAGESCEVGWAFLGPNERTA